MPEPPHISRQNSFLNGVASAYRSHRKIVNENLGLIVALIAAVFAGWSSFEAHKTRVEAGEIGSKTLETQIRSVQAQLDATQLDERPYIRVDFDHAQSGRNGNYAWVKMTDYGRTAAHDITFRINCTEREPDLVQLGRSPQGSLDVLFPQQSLTPASFHCDKASNFHGLGGSIFGVVTYRDSFEKTHETRFCYSFGGPKDWDWCDKLSNHIT